MHEANASVHDYIKYITIYVKIRPSSSSYKYIH